MRIAILNHQRLRLPNGEGPPSSGSIGHYCYEMAVRLADQAEVTVYSPKGGRFRARESEHRGVRFVEIPSELDESIERGAETLHRIIGRGRDPRRPLFATRLHFGLFSARIARDLRRSGCEFVHVVNRSEFVPAIHAKNPAAKIHLHMQCEWLTQLDPSLIADRVAVCTHVSGCSAFVADRIASAFPDVSSRCFALLNGVDVERFSPAHAGERESTANGEHGPRILFAGRISPEKGVHHLVEAFERVIDRFPDARLELVGPRHSAPYELVAALADDARTRELSRFYDPTLTYVDRLMQSVRPDVAARIDLVGNVDQEQLARRMRRADLFVHPSAWCEPFGMSILEAMASAVPVVATQSGGIPEFVEHGRTGMLVERGSTDELAEAMLALLADPIRMAEIGAAGRKDAVDRWTWRHTADRLLEQVLGRSA